MIERHRGASEEEFRLVLRPNASLTPSQARLLIGMMGLMMGAIGLGFAAVGAWLVLPFSGGELLLLGYALSYSMRQGAVRETITVSRDTIQIEHKGPDRKERREFLRAWFRVEWQPGPAPRLRVGSHGKWVEVGAFLAEEEKMRLAGMLRQLRIQAF
ncbi:hypothetical protein MIT9_P1990 [Methylomarinovum caldicuralii]|uniref:DUF2244 domain-containing protein n=1 Tax=Methylomarinovum caldicuralii TaxID=438856 RepID=A0AAU9C5K0_9GAMM|nr:DUF2244 domain-containing protein [Methylomarinovum caldicuralii]BCX82404.1 hypothetical protein MIT9_P1990 [Methylomarinovum caldicuralii]